MDGGCGHRAFRARGAGASFLEPVHGAGQRLPGIVAGRVEKHLQRLGRLVHQAARHASHFVSYHLEMHVLATRGFVAWLLPGRGFTMALIGVAVDVPGFAGGCTGLHGDRDRIPASGFQGLLSRRYHAAACRAMNLPRVHRSSSWTGKTCARYIDK